MDKETLQDLDFYRIREILVSLCATELGMELAQNLEPVMEEQELKIELERVEEMVGLDAEPPLSGISDIRGLLVQVEAGGVLTPNELWQVRQVCERFENCGRFFRGHRDKIRALKPMADEIVVLPDLKRAIDQAIDESGAIKDSASQRLTEFRAELRERRNQLVKRMERMIEDEPDRFEGTVVVRGERFVLPVKLEAKNQVPGVIHSVSATGQTVFIEPFETITEQNRLQELRDAERSEIERIQRELTGLVFRSRRELAMGLNAIGTLDLLLAKSRFTKRFNCVRPIIDQGLRLELVQVRHPLLVLHKPDVVPLDFRLPDSIRIVLVSGPNAGGKTVVLKTIGLCALLLRCGMFVPASEGTRMPLFEQVFAGIGDEQSLEADVSSFTAHLNRLKEILAAADARSLVLIDEIGSRTAPEEGSALAIAVLEELRNRGGCTVVTTHFNSLKAYVQNEPGMANAAMEFRDGPTYRLIMGLPGESSALEIAEQSGLPRKVVERAKELVGREWVDFKTKLQALNQELSQAKRARQEVEENSVRAKEMAEVYEKRLKEFENWQAQERRRFLIEQERLLKDMRRQIENLVRELRERRADRASIVQGKRFVEEQQNKVEAQLQKATEPAPAFAIGDIVESTLFHRQGRVLDNKGEGVVVEFGNIRLEVDPRSLKLASTNGNRQTKNNTFEFEFVPKLNIRGMTREEAKMALNRFLTEATAAGVKELSVLHGKGSGALRQMLWKRLRQDARIADIRFAEPAEGGMGVTIIKLRGDDD
ncbi:MAG: endonuclease MutS2 [bacterium]